MLSRIKSFLGLDYYTSPLDQFLEDFAAKHPRLSASQRQEKEKYARIYELRDDPSNELENKEKLWDKF